MYRRERSGKPIFSPLDESLLHGHGGNGQVHPRPEANVQDFLPPSNLETIYTYQAKKLKKTKYNWNECEYDVNIQVCSYL